MDNKLSELSKPVAYTDSEELRFHHATSDMWPVPLGFGKDVPLYSQEYVSALLAERDAFEGAALAVRDELREARAELEANNLQCRGTEQERELFRIERAAHQQHAQELEKRIAELEHVVAAAKCDDELWDAMAHRLKTLEAKLATPVDINLPERRDDSYDWDGASPSEAFNTCRSICGLMFRQQLRAVGVKVEGDE